MISRWLVSSLGVVGTVISFQLFAATAAQVDSSEHVELKQAHKGQLLLSCSLVEALKVQPTLACLKL